MFNPSPKSSAAAARTPVRRRTASAAPRRVAAFALALVWLAAALVAHAAGLRPADIFGGAMVLQRETNVPVWGDALPNAKVTVTFAGQTKVATANGAGKWRVDLDSLQASAEGRDLTIASGDESLTYGNVLVGEVWLASGQSNMEWGVLDAGVLDAQKIIAEANYPGIRLFVVRKAYNAAPQEHFAAYGPWLPCTPDTIKRGSQRGFSAVAYLYALELHKKLNVPVGIIQAAWGGTRIEPWTPVNSFNRFGLSEERSANLKKYAAAAANAKGRGNHSTPGYLYNAMIHPLVPYAIRGAIWYQGEANLGELDYADKAFAHIYGWRDAWHRDLSFYYVQLAPYTYGSKPKTLLPVTWEQQTDILRLVHGTGMAIINDVGNPRNIHPGDKTTVAARLARLAFSRTYGVKFADDSGPLWTSIGGGGDTNGLSVVGFKHAKSGLKTRDGAPPSHFEVAGKDNQFKPAVARILPRAPEDKEDIVQIKLTSPEVPQILSVRFAWDQNAVPNLINGEGLPAGAFFYSCTALKSSDPTPAPKPAAPATAPAPASNPADKPAAAAAAPAK